MALPDLLYRAALGIERRVPGLLQGARKLEEVAPVIEPGNPLTDPAFYQKLVQRTAAKLGVSEKEAVPKVALWELERVNAVTAQPQKLFEWRPVVDPYMPQVVPEIAPRVRPGWFRRRLSRDVVGEMTFGEKSNPVVDNLAGRVAHAQNLRNHLEDWTATVAEFRNQTGHTIEPLSSNKDFMVDLANTFAPIAEDYSRMLPLAQTFQKHVKAARAAMAERAEFLAAGETTKAEGRLQAAINQAAKANAVKPELDALNTKIQPVLQGFQTRWLDRSPEVRIAMGAFPEMFPYVGRPLSDLEQRMAGMVRQFATMTSEAYERRGIPLKQRLGVPHLMDVVEDSLKMVHSPITHAAESTLPVIRRLARTSPGAAMWVPDIATIMDRYIQRTHTHLARTTFLQKWSPYMRKVVMPHNPPAYRWWRNYVQRQDEFDKTLRGMGRYMEAVTWWKHMVATGFSTSTGFKHGTKTAFLLAMHPKEAIQMAPMRLRVAVGNVARKLGASTSVEADLVHNLLAYRGLYRMLYGMHDLGGKWAGTMQFVSMNPTLAVEQGERGLAILAALLKGYNKKLSFEQTYRGLLQTILDVNFMGGVDRPQWLDKPWQRLVALFAYTPAKMLSRSYKWAARSIPEMDLEALRQGLWSHVLRFPRDAFGTPYVNHVAKAAVVLGLAEGVARSQGISILDITLAHIPLTRERPGGGIGASIPIYQPVDDFFSLGGNLEAAKLAFARNFLEWQGLKRAYRAYHGDLPKMYAPGEPGATARYLMARPYLPAKEKESKKWEKRHKTERRRGTIEKQLFIPPFSWGR